MGRVALGLVRLVANDEDYAAVLLAGSGTAAVEAALASTVPADGRLLVLDNGAYGERLASIARAYLMPHDTITFGIGEWIDVERIAKRLEQERYTQLAVVHHETTTGMLNPIEALGTLCRERGVELIVDAMSSFAGIPISMAATSADFLISSANKCIQAMAGLSFVIARRDRLQSMTSIPGRSLYLDLGLQYRFFESHSQMRFTPPVQLLHALDTAIEELEAEGGVTARHRRYCECWRVLDAGMHDIGFRRLLPDEQLSHILTSYFEPTHEGYSFERFHDLLYGRGFTIYPGKVGKSATFRLANMGAIGPEDIERFITAVRETVVDMGIEALYPD